MFTNNYITFRNMMFFGNTGTLKTPANTSFTAQYVAASNSNSYNGYPFDLGYSMRTGRCNAIPIELYKGNYGYVNYSQHGVYFGSGTTPAAKTDYTLEAPITSGLTITNPSTYLLDNDGAGKYTYSMPFILTNTTSTDIVINEVGLFTPQYYYNSSSNYGYYICLMERTVLDTPVVVPARDSVLFTYKISFHHIME